MKLLQRTQTSAATRTTPHSDNKVLRENDTSDIANFAHASLLAPREPPHPRATQALANLQRTPNTAPAHGPTSPPRKNTLWPWLALLGGGSLLSVLLRGGSEWDPSVNRYRRPNGRFKRR
ncbi:MAG: hypothetical protein SFV15_11700 [Polyangiaceae bacterium]|nr:hypothetical protein [Polyangiaceae bacterium]